MPYFSKTSLTRLATCDENIQRLFIEVIRHFDVRIVQGYRGQLEQEQAFKEGRSEYHWPRSKHNQLPSKAVDVVPYPVDWKNTNRFFYLSGLVDGISEMMGIDVRWGGDWDSDKDFSDQKFNDLPHFELGGTK